MRAAAAETRLARCAMIGVDEHAAGDGALPNRVRAAFAQGAPAVVVLCAAGARIEPARAELRALDGMLAATVAELGARVSRSATDGLAAWAASLSGPIGVDVQSRPDREHPLDTTLLAAALHPSERRWLAAQADTEAAFARLWAGKEAVLKAFGVGLAWSPRAVPVLPIDASWRRVQVPLLGHAWLSHPDASGTPDIALAVALNAGQSRPD